MKRFSITLLALVTMSCAKESDLLYWRPNPDPEVLVQRHIVKDFSGFTHANILWVIDNSGSMSSHHANLIHETNRFINVFTGPVGIQWSIGLLSTDITNPPFLGFDGIQLNHNTRDPVRVFQEAVGRLGISGSAIEKSFDPVIRHMVRVPGWVSPQALLSIIFVTDAPEQSSISATAFYQRLVALKGDATALAAYGILNPTDWCRATDTSWLWERSPFQTFFNLIQGQTWKLCDANFGQSLAEIATNIGRQVISKAVFLRKRPQVKTILVKYLGRTLPGGPFEDGGVWYYHPSSNSVIFYNLEFSPDRRAQVEVTYEEDDGWD